METIVLFDEFEVPKIKGLEYLVNDSLVSSDYMFINELKDGFSMYFEKDFPIFTVPERTERDYGLFELKRRDKTIRFFCPERRENLSSVVWYFFVEYYDESGGSCVLPGQVRVTLDMPSFIQAREKPGFIDVLERVKPVRLSDNYII